MASKHGEKTSVREPRASVFLDYDGTLTPLNMVDSYVLMNLNALQSRASRFRFLIKEILRAPIYLTWSKLNLRSFEDHYHSRYAGLPAKELEERFETCFKHVLKGYLFPMMIAKVAEFRAAGYAVVVVSNSIDYVIRNVAHYLQADAFYCPTIEIQNGILTGRLLPPLSNYHTKADAVLHFAALHGIDLAKSFAYGDSQSDVSMFELVGNPVLVNGSARMRLLATKRKWERLTM